MTPPPELRRGGKRRWILASLVAGGVCSFALLLWGFVIEPRMLVVREITLHLQDWNPAHAGLRVAFLSDTHTGSPHNGLKRLHSIVETVNAQSADLVLLGGDYLVLGVLGGEVIEPEPIAEALRRLDAPLGVYAVLGNHEWWHNIEQCRAAFVAVELPVLDDAVVQVEHNDESFWLLGLSDLRNGPHLRDATFAQLADDAPVIVLTHDPDAFVDVPPRASLTLAGHTHGGQVNLPVFGRIKTPSWYGQRFAYGHVVEGGRQLFVTAGIGTSILPVRFRSPPEVVVLTLHPAEPARS